MTEKELLYVEDIYNHSNLLIEIANKYVTQVKCEDYSISLKNSIKTHKLLVKKIEKLLCGESNE